MIKHKIKKICHFIYMRRLSPTTLITPLLWFKIEFFNTLKKLKKSIKELKNGF